MSWSDGPDLYNEATVKARKLHYCDECRREIQVGSRHRLVKGMWDGDWAQYRICNWCESVRSLWQEHLGRSDYEDLGFHLLGGLYDSIKEYRE